MRHQLSLEFLETLLFAKSEFSAGYKARNMWKSTGGG